MVWSSAITRLLCGAHDQLTVPALHLSVLGVGVLAIAIGLTAVVSWFAGSVA
ncbi:hypothetical protein [Actinomadura rubrisoli]|uniref:hypothetical protein n=1 Tax=Actinomadura rubrisoli TaxID=2530368 RepID=UPI0014051CB8|nr:hypothetical protein [Actinomadura rubrisoli]